MRVKASTPDIQLRNKFELSRLLVKFALELMNSKEIFCSNVITNTSQMSTKYQSVNITPRECLRYGYTFILVHTIYKCIHTCKRMAHYLHKSVNSKYVS